MSDAHPTPLGQDSTAWRAVDSSPGLTGIASRVLESFEEAVRTASSRQGLELTNETPLFELGIDSLKQLEIVGRIQDEFDVRIPEDRLYEIETCGDVAEAIEEQMRQKASPAETANKPSRGSVDPFGDLPEYRRLRSRMEMLEAAGCENPFFAVHDAVEAGRTHLDDRQLIDFGRFNYLGMSGDPTINEAAKAAIDHFGTSVASSRLVSGTTTLHRDVERTLAGFLGVDDALVFTSGFVTNATIVAQLVGADDLILHDELIHHSILTGSQLSAAERLSFPHNDWQALEQLLSRQRDNYRRVLIAIEGVYSMDGDYPDLPKFLEVKSRQRAMLMLDEAHSLGTMGGSGRGLCEVFGVEPREVDVLVGTIGKALGGAGGFVAGSSSLVEFLKYTCPGIIFSTGLAPPCAAAALAALRLLEQEPQRVATLHARADLFLKLARQHGFNVGSSEGTPIVPVILGSSILALHASQGMLQRGFNVPPILYPAVEEERARLRFFISARHSEADIESAVAQLAEVLAGLNQQA